MSEAVRHMFKKYPIGKYDYNPDKLPQRNVLVGRIYWFVWQLVHVPNCVDCKKRVTWKEMEFGLCHNCFQQKLYKNFKNL